jgi:hypothetical protein
MCLMWFVKLLDFYDTSNGIFLLITLDASRSHDSSNFNMKVIFVDIVGGVTGRFVFIMDLVLLLFWCCRCPKLSIIEYVQTSSRSSRVESSSTKYNGHGPDNNPNNCSIIQININA